MRKKKPSHSPVCVADSKQSEIRTAPSRSKSGCAKKNRLILMKRFVLSGQQDSNLRPPAPKAGALAGLRHAPIIFGGEGGIRTPGTLSSTTV